MAEKTYNVGIYCRLSNDDLREGESVSIENQENICQGGFHQTMKFPYNRKLSLHFSVLLQ